MPGTYRRNLPKEPLAPLLHFNETVGGKCKGDDAVLASTILTRYNGSARNNLIDGYFVAFWGVYMDYRSIITIESGKRGGRPCIRGMRISVYDILGWLAAGMTNDQIQDDFPELTVEDIRAALAFAADREHQLPGSAA